MIITTYKSQNKKIKKKFSSLKNYKNFISNINKKDIVESVSPSKIIAISEIPKTKNGKLVELAVKQSIEGEEIKNLEALANPDSLRQFKNIRELNE